MTATPALPSTPTSSPEPITVAIALALYSYNVSPLDRAQRLHSHFGGDCMDTEDMVYHLTHHSAAALTALPFPTAEAYVTHALEEYGEEAQHRVNRERIAYIKIHGSLDSLL